MRAPEAEYNRLSKVHGLKRMLTLVNAVDSSLAHSKIRAELTSQKLKLTALSLISLLKQTLFLIPLYCP